MARLQFCITFAATFVWLVAFSVAITSVAAVVSNDACHPPVHLSSDVFIIGYGSLINTQSKNVTAPTAGISLPVNVNGFARKWGQKSFSVGPGPGTTFLTVVKRGGASFNGVAFKLQNASEVYRVDRREVGYCRYEVPPTGIDFLVDANHSQVVGATFPTEISKYYVYAMKEEDTNWPNDRYPIVQSYVDVFIGGCMDVEKTYNLSNYKDMCFTKTEGWNYTWINDRLLPRRPWVYMRNAISIDILTHQHLPNHFAEARIVEPIQYNYVNVNSDKNKSPQHRHPLGVLYS